MDEKRRKEIEELVADAWTYCDLDSTTAAKALDDLLDEIDRLAPDAKLGAAVRGMADWTALAHEATDSGKEYWAFARMGVSAETGPTPEAALRAAGLMEDNNE